MTFPKTNTGHISPALLLVMSTLASSHVAHAQEPNRIEPIGFATKDYPVLSPDGRYLAFSANIDGDRDIYIEDTTSGAIRQLTNNDYWDNTPDWTPDGKRLVYQSEPDGQRDIVIADVATGAVRQLTYHPAEDSHPKVSADGAYIVFDSNRRGKRRASEADYDVYLMTIDGDEITKIADSDGWDTYPDLSEDRSMLVWRRAIPAKDGERNSEVFLKDLASGDVRNLTKSDAFDGYPDFTPEGLILFSSNRAGRARSEFDLYIMPPAGGTPQRLTYSTDRSPRARMTRPRHSGADQPIVANLYDGPNNVAAFVRPFGNSENGGLNFVRVETSPLASDGGLSRGVAVADADGDGYLDIAIGNTIMQADLVYWNGAGGALEQEHDDLIVQDAGWTEGVVWVDVDNDGDADLYKARTQGGSALLMNVDGRTFEAASQSDLTTDNSSVSQACWADVNGDGLLDVATATRNGADTGLFFNAGGGVFVEASPNPFAGTGGNARTCAFGDADGDGDADLAIGNFVGTRNGEPIKEPGLFFLGDGGGGFTKAEIKGFTDRGARSYGLSWTDIDNDGDMDLTQTRIARSDEHLAVFLNEDGVFVEAFARLFEGVVHGPSKGHAWGDFDNDGDVDLAVANGTEGVESSDIYTLQNFLFENDNGTMRKIDAGDFTAASTISAGLAHGDIDDDGDLDIVVANWGGADEDNALFRNTGAARGWLRVALVGDVSNRMGVGAKIICTATINGKVVKQTREVNLNTGYGSMSDPRAHFGLGDATTVERLEILWPTGKRQVLTSSPANRTLTIREDDDGLSVDDVDD
ncbi:MAG: FG-GAP-like repeat-containing protein [Pseudomonadota bacterium]